MATRCCWPPESSDGRCLRRSERPTRSMIESSQSLSILPPPSSSGRTMFSSAVSMGRRLKNWKTKPICSPAELRQLVVAEIGDARPVDRDIALGRLVQAGEDVHERRLARARRAHDGGELAALDVERDAAQRVHRRVPLAVDAGDVPRRHDGAVGSCWSDLLRFGSHGRHSTEPPEGSGAVNATKGTSAPQGGEARDLKFG